MKEFHLATEAGKNAKLLLFRPKGSRPKTQNVTSLGEPVQSVRIHRGTPKTLPEGEDLSTLLIDSDPEVDLETVGLILEESSQAYYKEDSKEIQNGFEAYEEVFTPTGELKEKRKALSRKANINDTHPVKIAKRIPIAKACRQFAFSGQYALNHSDGLSYDFLYNLAKELHEKKELAVLGAGPKGNAPLVFLEKGSPKRAFLFGEVEGDKYRLLILCSNQEIKIPQSRLKKSEENAN